MNDIFYSPQMERKPRRPRPILRPRPQGNFMSFGMGSEYNHHPTSIADVGGGVRTAAHALSFSELDPADQEYILLNRKFKNGNGIRIVDGKIVFIGEGEERQKDYVSPPKDVYDHLLNNHYHGDFATFARDCGCD